MRPESAGARVSQYLRRARRQGAGDRGHAQGIHAGEDIVGGRRVGGWRFASKRQFQIIEFALDPSPREGPGSSMARQAAD
jgi:hypothetical protein